MPNCLKNTRHRIRNIYFLTLSLLSSIALFVSMTLLFMQCKLKGNNEPCWSYNLSS